MHENSQLIAKWVENLKKASPLSYHETFTDQVHGWMTSRYVDSYNRLPWRSFVPQNFFRLIRVDRADFNNLHVFEEYLRGYRIVRSFFAQHL